jgi:hypothetical protein
MKYHNDDGLMLSYADAVGAAFLMSHLHVWLPFNGSIESVYVHAYSAVNKRIFQHGY